MSADRRTKAQLVTELKRAEARIDELDAVKSITIEAPARVPEAETLADCVRALDRLTAHRERWQTGSEVSRVLRSLADRYGVELFRTEVQVQECSRAHLDEMDGATLGAYLISSASASPDRERRRR